MKFDYYYGQEAEQFTFIRLPKILFTDEKFKQLSSNAKILYGYMLDRMSLSVKNQWIDKENRVYIIFTLENVMEVFSCSERKASYLMKELDTKSGIGLIEKKRQGLGKPNLIYVKNFVSNATESSPDENMECVKEKSDNKIGKSTPVMNGENVQSQSCKNEQFQNGNNVQLQSCKNEQSQASNCVQVKSGEELQPNNTDYSKSENSETIYPSSNHMNETGEMDVIEKYRQLLKDNMEYELLKEKLSIGEGDYLDEMLELMVETICIHCDSVRIGSKDIPYQLVKARLLKINAMHIEYVIDCLQKTTNKIHNIKAYLLTMLYNAPTTINSYYRTEVNYDMQNGFAIQDEFAV